MVKLDGKASSGSRTIRWWRWRVIGVSSVVFNSLCPVMTGTSLTGETETLARTGSLEVNPSPTIKGTSSCPEKSWLGVSVSVVWV